MKIFVRDVVGPMPSENQCYIILSAENKTIPLRCTYSDAEMCYTMLQGEVGPCPYEFFVNTLEVLQVRMQSAELEIVNGITYSKIYFSSPHLDKPLRLASANASAGVNASLAGKCSLEASETFTSSAPDVTVQYNCMANILGKLWPLPQLDRTEAMEAVSDFLDKVQTETQA